MVGRIDGKVTWRNCFHAPGAVDFRRFVELGIHGGDGRKVDDGAPARLLDDPRDGKTATACCLESFM